MNPQKRLALVLAFALCILLVVSLFPAADPRIDIPGAGSGDWGALTETAESETGSETREPDYDSGDRSVSNESQMDSGERDGEDVEIEIRPELDGEAIPGRTATVGVDDATLDGSGHTQATLLVDGERVGAVAGNETTRFDVPVDADELNVSVEETSDTVAFAVDTDVAITVYGAPIPDRVVDLESTVGQQAFSHASVLVDGEEVTTTDAAGNASVRLPETAGETEIRVEDGGASGTHTVDVGEPSVAFNSFFLFPGTPTTVSVSVGDEPVENATVAVGDGSETTTSSSGTTWVTPPISDEATVTAEVGAEQASTTVSNLYLRTMLVVLGIPGLILGALWTYFRYAPSHWRRRHDISGVFLSFAGVLASAASLWRSVRQTRPRLPSSLWPTRWLTLPRLSLRNRGFGGFSLSLPSFAALFSSVPSPGVPRNRWRRSTSANSKEHSDDGEPDGSDETEASDDGPEPTPGEREQLRSVWHTFLDHLGLRRRETLTPGEASRHAIAAGYPARCVRRLLGVFRDVEYGGTAPTPEDVSHAQDSVETLVAYDPDEMSADKTDGSRSSSDRRDSQGRDHGNPRGDSE